MLRLAGEANDGPVAFAAPSITEDDVEAVTRVLRSGWITTGEECVRLEAELASYLDVAHVVSFSSCTAALEASVAYLNLPAGARVGIPTWTFAATALAAVRAGATPVLLDVDPRTLNLDARALERAVDEGLEALLPVHFGGVPVDRDIHAAAAAASIPVIEDAAHALGARDVDGPVAGRAAVSACFSFYATKNLTSAEGGALATVDPELDAFARSYRQHGMSRDAWNRYRLGSRPLYDVVLPGIKANLPDILAALARSQLRRFGEMQAHRRRLVQRYRTNLEDQLELVPARAVEGSADHLVVVLLPVGLVRDEVVAALSAAGVGCSVHFVPLHHMTWFRRHAVIAGGTLPAADAAALRALSLPLHTNMTVGHVDRVCDVVTQAVGRP